MYKEIDQFRTYIEEHQSGFKGLIQKRDSYQKLISQRLAMDRVYDHPQDQGVEGLIDDTRYGVTILGDERNKDLLHFTRSTKGAEGKAMGMERKRLKTEKKFQRRIKGLEMARQAWAQQIRTDSKHKVRVTKSTVKPARVPVSNES